MAAEQARSQRMSHLPAALCMAFVVRYDELLAAGLAANPPPDRGVRRCGRIKQSPARNLLERLWLGQDQVLAFLDDLAIQSGWARPAHAQSAEGVGRVSLTRRSRGVRLHSWLPLDLAQAGLGTPGRPRDRVCRRARLSPLQMKRRASTGVGTWSRTTDEVARCGYEQAAFPASTDSSQEERCDKRFRRSQL